MKTVNRKRYSSDFSTRPWPWSAWAALCLMWPRSWVLAPASFTAGPSHNARHKGKDKARSSVAQFSPSRSAHWRQLSIGSMDSGIGSLEVGSRFFFLAL